MERFSFDEKVLIAEDDPEVAELIKEKVEGEGYAAIVVNDGFQGLFETKQHKIFLILSDYHMPNMNGIEFCQAVRKFRPSLPFIMISTGTEREMLISGIRTGINDFLDKPLDWDALERCVHEYAAKRQEQIHQELEESEMLQGIFIEEARALLDNLDEDLLCIEKNPQDKNEFNNIFRKIHTLKGSAGAIAGGQTTAHLAHAFESLLAALKEGKSDINRYIIDAMLKCADLLRQCIDGIEGRAPHPDTKAMILELEEILQKGSQAVLISAAQPNSVTAERKEEADEGVIVSNEKLDHFMELAGELVAFKNAFYGFVKHRIADQGLNDMNKNLSRLTDDLQARIMDIRKVSLQKAFSKFPRLVRGVAQDLAKNVRYEVEGLELQVDKTIARSLAACLVHVIRNACDHGIESVERRSKLGKDPSGRLLVSAFQVADLITVKVTDDGAGLDTQRIHAKAAAKGLVTEDIKRMSDQEIFELLFLPGFSTAEFVTDLSGRGVGMDVVKTSILALDGTVRLDSNKDQGTTLTIQIPTPKSIMVEQSIVVESNDILMAIPLSCIGEIRSVKEMELTYLAPFWTIERGGRIMPLASFDQLMHPNAINPQQHGIRDGDLIIEIMHKERSLALRVDEVRDQMEAVVRPFDGVTQSIPGFKGTSILPGDQLGYMVSAEELLELVRNIASRVGDNYACIAS